jgi:hypothetical protein
MRRIAVLLACVLFASVSAHAQLGITGGLTSSSTQVKDMESVKALNQYHAGLVYKFDLGLGFAVQPGVIYQVKGARLGSIGTEAKGSDFELKTGFVEVPVQLQWGPDLLAFRPYLFAEPFIGYAVSSSDQVEGSGSVALKNWAQDAKNKIEYGFGLGAGLEIASHFQLSVQYFNNLGKVFNGKTPAPASEGTAEPDGTGVAPAEAEPAATPAPLSERVRNFQGLKFTLTVLF